MTFLSSFKRRAFLTTLAALSCGFAAACAPTSPPQTPSANASSAAPSDSGSGGGTNVSLNGAGASFPAPLYQRWFADYNKENPGVQISYQSVGSGAGIEQFIAGTVDFGASDAPFKPAEREKFKAKYGVEPIQVPMTGGSIVFAYNLDGVKQLNLSRTAYCGIVTGKITKWSDPAIASANSGAKLPDQPIQFVHRSDGSGTTNAFTSHLKAACPDWKAGAAKSVDWPVGTGAKGNEGVTAQVQQTPGAVGYVEYSYANENNLAMAAIENKSGKMITPTPDAGSLAFKGQPIPDDLALQVPDSTNPEAYPISTLTWLLVYPEYQDAAKESALKAVIDWSLSKGKKDASDLGYVPLNDELVGKVDDALSKVKTK